MESYYNKFLNIYNKFYFYDLRYSLLLGREYELIWNFLLVYNSSILGDRTNKEILEDLIMLEELVDGYIAKLKSIFEDEEEIQDIVKVNVENIFLILKSSDCVWNNMYKSYILLSKATDSRYHKVLLIEINNFFSHILANNEGNIQRSVAHLHRAALDGYKEIIKINSNIMLANSGLKKRFLELRKKEGSMLGIKNNNDKCELSNIYYNIATDLVGLLYMK